MIPRKGNGHDPMRFVVRRECDRYVVLDTRHGLCIAVCRTQTEAARIACNFAEAVAG